MLKKGFILSDSVNYFILYTITEKMKNTNHFSVMYNKKKWVFAIDFFNSCWTEYFHFALSIYMMIQNLWWKKNLKPEKYLILLNIHWVNFTIDYCWIWAYIRWVSVILKTKDIRWLQWLTFPTGGAALRCTSQSPTVVSAASRRLTDGNLVVGERGGGLPLGTCCVVLFFSVAQELRSIRSIHVVSWSTDTEVLTQWEILHSATQLCVYLAAECWLVPLMGEGIDSEHQDLAAGRSSNEERKKSSCFQLL